MPFFLGLVGFRRYFVDLVELVRFLLWLVGACSTVVTVCTHGSIFFGFSGMSITEPVLGGMPNPAIARTSIKLKSLG